MFPSSTENGPLSLSLFTHLTIIIDSSIMFTGYVKENFESDVSDSDVRRQGVCCSIPGGGLGSKGDKTRGKVSQMRRVLAVGSSHLIPYLSLRSERIMHVERVYLTCY